ncbi:GGDEF domain-containing protein [Bradyrhizobium sp.]|uniref:GGDEF domain-containing protein n=1 Tax=Bradyrhizobium sp. TaxID=376 RepID=UPI0025C29E10|nr:GGDEF domain-containing protein [Bradyrhizobium sp.]
MSQQGPIIVVSRAERPPFASALDDAKLFPVIDASWADASRAVAQLAPAAVLVASSEAAEPGLDALAEQIAATKPYLPLIVVDPAASLPANAIPLAQSGGNFDRLLARLRAALRVRTLHSTVLRRLDGDPAARAALDDTDPARDATVLLIGRGASYPSLSVALGERMGVVGALSLEAAAKHLNVRDIDGVVLGEGFSPRVEDAFLTVLSEDVRFRNLPVVLTSGALAPTYDLPNLESVSGEPALVAANALPLIRQHAFETHLGRMLKSIEAGGLLDSRTGLLAPSAFNQDFINAVSQTLSHGGGLSVACFSFDPRQPRAQLDGARILSRLMRRMDFGAAQNDGSVLVVFAETDLRTAHGIARRLLSVLRHTSHGKRDARAEPTVTVATLSPSDTAKSLLARLHAEARGVAS